MDIVVIKRNRAGEPQVKIITSLEWLARRVSEYHHDAQAAELVRNTLECGGSYTYEWNGLSFEASAY